MNNVRIKVVVQNPVLTVHGLLEFSARGKLQTAFIGKVGSGKYGLYLISYLGIAFAADPTSTWCIGGDAAVWIEKFVDIDIIVKEQTK